VTVPLYNLTDTWNSAGTAFTAILMNVTNTASAAASKFLDLQIGGVSTFNVDKSGYWALGAGDGATAADAFMYRDAAQILAQRNSANAQTFRVYNSFTDASNYERATISWASNILIIGTEKAGTGSNRGMKFVATSGEFTFISPGSSVTPANNGELMIQATSNTSLTFKYKGSDGTVRSGSITLA
jgi:hypothetical protein